MSVFIVAELSANHKQDFTLAKESLYAIKECRADAIKLQTYTPSDLTIDCKSEIFQIKSDNKWSGKYLYDLYKEAFMPTEWHFELFSIARKIGLVCFSSIFSKDSIALLESLDNPIYKIASFEVLDLDLIENVAKLGKPIMLSSGIATNSELKEAIDCIKSHSTSDITLLKCVSSYPAKTSDMNLCEMKELGQNFGVKFGLSDHSVGNLAGIIATSLGASVIEKHFIMDKKIDSADSHFSLDRAEFSDFVKIIRESEMALRNNKQNSDSYKSGREFGRSLFVVKDIKKDEILTEENIKSIRPNNGLPPKFLKQIIGKKATKNLPFGKPLEWSDFS